MLQQHLYPEPLKEGSQMKRSSFYWHSWNKNTQQHFCTRRVSWSSDVQRITAGSDVTARTGCQRVALTDMDENWQPTVEASPCWQLRDSPTHQPMSCWRQFKGMFLCLLLSLLKENIRREEDKRAVDFHKSPWMQRLCFLATCELMISAEQGWKQPTVQCLGCRDAPSQ